jgi:hypothetical protein
MTNETTNADIRMIKTGTCPTLSNKSTLTYNIGCDANAQVYLRIAANSAAGYFKPEWVSLAAIRKTTEKAAFITAFHLRPVFVGRSTNSPGFLLAALKAEGLVKLKGEKERVYVAQDSTAFMAAVKSLINAKPDDDAATAPAAIKKSSSSKTSPK